MNRKSKKSSAKPLGLDIDQHHRIHTIIVGYTAFVFAFLLGLASFADKTGNVSIVMGLLLISLPALISFTLMDFIVRVKQKREGSAFRGMAWFTGFGPSLVALGLFVWPYAPWASIAFGVSIPFWGFAITEVAGARPGSRI